MNIQQTKNSNQLNQLSIAIEKYIATPSQIINNIRKVSSIAIPIITTLAITTAAEAGPILCGLCIGSCLSLSGATVPALLPGCAIACAPLCLAPTG
jgi:hypothetical protein